MLTYPNHAVTATIALAATSSRLATPNRAVPRPTPEDADRKLVDVLLAEKLITPQAVAPLLQRRRAGEPTALVQLLVTSQIAKLDELLLAIVRRSRLPYLPLAQYNVNADALRLLPAHFCAHHTVIAFDRISRAVLMATANPFDLQTRQEVQARLACRIFWFVTPPVDITEALNAAHPTQAVTEVA